MTKNEQPKLNRFELELQKQLSNLMTIEKVKFTRFLPQLVADLPKKGTPEYTKVNKKEYIKFIRSSFTVDEIHKILNEVNWKLSYKINNTDIEISNYILLDDDNSAIRLRFTDLMMSCELLGIKIIWIKRPIEEDFQSSIESL